MMNFDVLVIGNGVLGLSTAYALSLEDPTVQIGIIGPNNKLSGASIAAGAMLGCFGEVTDSGLKSEHGLEKLNLAVKASEMWPDWIKQINASLAEADKVTIRDGTFIILNANSGSLDDKNYGAILKALEMYDESHEQVDPRDIPGMSPVESCRPLKALFIPSEGSINANSLLFSLHKAISARNNISFVDDVAVKIATSFSKIDSVTTESGTVVTANKFLLAAGAYSQFLLDQIPPLQFRVPRLLFGAGSSLILKHSEAHNFAHVVRSPNRAASCGAHIIPYSDNTLYVGASNCLRFEEMSCPRTQDIYYLIERAIEQFNQNLHKAQIVKYQIGNRPVSIDSYPLIGRTPVDNLWLLTGTYRDGIHDSPLLAQFMAKEILGLPTNMENKFSPARQPIQVLNREQSINQFVEHNMSAAHEHSIKLPKIGWHDFLEDWWRSRGESLYATLGVQAGLSPELLIMLDQEPACMQKFKKYYHELNACFSTSTVSFSKPVSQIKLAS